MGDGDLEVETGLDGVLHPLRRVTRDKMKAKLKLLNLNLLGILAFTA